MNVNGFSFQKLSYVFLSIALWALSQTAFAAFTTPSEKLANQKLTFYYHSLGKPTNGTVLLLGGGPGFSSWNLEPIQKWIASNGYEVFLMDMAGIGENQKAANKNYINTWVNQIHLLLARKTKQKTILIGHSWGALMAMLYLKHYPDSAEKLILLNPVDPEKKSMQFITAEIHHRNLQETHASWDDETAWEHNTDTSHKSLEEITLRQIHQVIPTYFYDYRLGQKYAAQFNANDFNIKINIHAWKEYDNQPVTYQNTKNWSFPIYFMDCKEDYLMPYNLNEMQQQMTFNKTSILQHCGHFPWVEKPQQFEKILQLFLID